MTREEAMRKFAALVRMYGLKWTVQTPDTAYESLREINKVLTEADRREALGLKAEGR
jgi:hypothetical protein